MEYIPKLFLAIATVFLFHGYCVIPQFMYRFKEVLQLMKRQKRDQAERAFTKGYQAGIDGRSRSLCPHESGTARQQWLNGWRESRVDQWDGLNRMAQVQKLSNMQQFPTVQ